MAEVIQALATPEFKSVASKVATALRPPPIDEEAAREALDSFRIASIVYVTAAGSTGIRYARFTEAFTAAYARLGE